MYDVKKIFNTVRFMTVRQWRYRVYYTLRNKTKKRKPVNLLISDIQLLPLNYYEEVNNPDSLIIANDILQNRFTTISGIKKVFKGDVDWDLKNEEYRLISFKLNSFKWLLDLSDAFHTTGDIGYIKKGFLLIDDWVNKNGAFISGDKWNPYVIAERISNWIGFCSQYCELIDKSITPYASSINAQALELKNSIEYQLGANHLLSEAKALIFAGAFLKDKYLYTYGKNVLINEYKEQFLQDGSHYERSISYHVESLQQYFESTVLFNLLGDKTVTDFVKMMKKPYVFLDRMISVNGKIPLFNDAAIDYPFYDARDFLETSDQLFMTKALNSKKGLYSSRWRMKDLNKESVRWEVEKSAFSGGFAHYKFKVKEEVYSLFFDSADHGPDYNLGHAHADSLSILLSNSKKDILVDTGVYTYKMGEERNACRSTKAHNTVEIDGMNNAEIWSAFRVAKRGHARLQIITDTPKQIHLIGNSDGYEKCLKQKAMHKREIIASPGSILLKDYITGLHKCISRLHLGPECEVIQSSEKACIIDDSISIETSVPLKIVDWKIASEFGIMQKSKCIEIPFSTDDTNIVTIQISIN